MSSKRAAFIRRAAGLRALLVLALASCHGSCGGKSSDTGDAATDAGSSTDAALVIPPRCTAASHKGSLGVVVDVGDAILTPDGFVVGLVRDKNILSVATISPDLSQISFADIGAARREATPPQPFLWQNKVYIAWIDSGDLRLGRLDSGKVAMVADQVVDILTYSAKDPPMADLPAFDVAVSGDRGVVVWDHVYPTGGIIESASFTKDGFERIDGGLPIRIVSPPTSDVDTPRLAPRANGYWVVWMARKAEAVPEASAIEGPGETPSYHWLEAAPLDANGAKAADPTRLTPVLGRIAGYDVLPHDGASEVIARDAEETAPDEGTTLLRVTLGEKPSAAETLAANGIGRAVPAVVGSQASAWVVVPDNADATKLFPVVPAVAPASVEPLLKGARALALRAAPTGAELLAVRMTSAPSSADEAEIELVSCGR